MRGSLKFPLMTDREVKLYRLSNAVLSVLKITFFLLLSVVGGTFAYKYFVEGKPIKTVELRTAKEVIFVYEKGKNIEIRIPKGAVIRATLYTDRLNLKINGSIEIDLEGRWHIKERDGYIRIYHREREIEGKRL